jgi:hypothetical protein
MPDDKNTLVGRRIRLPMQISYTPSKRKSVWDFLVVRLITRWVICAVALIPFAAQAQSPGRGAPSDQAIALYLRVENTAPSPARPGKVVQYKTVVRNTSQEIITAYSLKVTAHYAHGQDWTSWQTDDILSGYLDPELSTVAVFRPGETAETAVQCPLDRDGLQATAVDVEPLAVTFADRTAVGDQERIGSILESRRSTAKYLADLISDLSEMSRESAIGTTLPTTPEEFSRRQKAVSGWLAEHVRYSPQSAQFQKRAADMNWFSKLLVGNKAAFDIKCEQYKKLQAKVAEHSNVEVIQ